MCAASMCLSVSILQFAILSLSEFVRERSLIQKVEVYMVKESKLLILIACDIISKVLIMHESTLQSTFLFLGGGQLKEESNGDSLGLCRIKAATLHSRHCMGAGIYSKEVKSSNTNIPAHHMLMSLNDTSLGDLD